VQFCSFACSALLPHQVSENHSETKHCSACLFVAFGNEFNCSGERLFSVLARVNKNLRTAMTDMNHQSLMATENDVVRNMDFNDVIDIFAKSKAPKAVF